MNLLSFCLPHFRPSVYFSLCALALLTPLKAENTNEGSPLLRIICVTAFAGNDECVLATKDEQGSWQEHRTVSLRTSFITEWIKSPHGDLHLCVREDGKLVSKCEFTYPKDSSRALLVLLPGEKLDEYKSRLIDTTKKGFGKGETLVLNSSSTPCEVMLGEKSVEAKPGEYSVQKPALEENGMFRTLVTYKDDSGETVTCDDRYVRSNAESRDLMVIVADTKMGIRVVTLSDFGPFE